MSSAVAKVRPDILPDTATANDAVSDDELVQMLATARCRLPAVRSLADAKGCSATAAALQTWLRRRHRRREVQNAAALLGILAERRCGELLEEHPPRRGRPPKSLPRESHSDLAFSAVEAHRWRKLTKVDVRDLEQLEAECTATGREFTRAYAWRRVQSALNTEEAEQPWTTWAARADQKAIHDAVNALHSWLAPFQPQGRAERAIARVLKDEDYLSEHDRALLATNARHVVQVLKALVDLCAV